MDRQGSPQNRHWPRKWIIATGLGYILAGYYRWPPEFRAWIHERLWQFLWGVLPNVCG